MTVNAARTVSRRLASMLLACLVFSGIVAMAVSRVSAVSAPNIISYQGRLLNSNGVPVADASADILFQIYNESSGGTCLWSNSASDCSSSTERTVTLTDGLFSENLGDTNHATPYAAILDSTFATADADGLVYLAVTVNGEPLLPRKMIVAAPFALNSDSLDGYDTTTAGATSSAVPVFDTSGNLVITGSPAGPGSGDGALYINPGAGVTAANETIFGIGVGGSGRLIVDAEGDIMANGDVQIMGGDLTTSNTSFNLLNTTVTTLTMAGAATLVDINNSAITSGINIGGTSQDGANTVNIATNPTSADSINIGNNNASTLVTVTGGNDWSIMTDGTFTTSGVINANNGVVTSTAPLTLRSTGGNLTLDANGVSPGLAYVTVNDDFAVGASALLAPFSVDESLNTVRIGDGINDANDPNITFYASNGSDSGILSFTDDDRFVFTGGNGLFAGARLQIDADTTADLPGLATNAGDLFVTGNIENDGSLSFGDTSGTDLFDFASAATTQNAIDMNFNALTSGSGLWIERADGVSDFDGKLMSIVQLESSVSSDATALAVTNYGGGDSKGLHITQNTVDDRSAGTSLGNQALVIDVFEDTLSSAGADDIVLIRSDADGVPDVEFVIEIDGEARADGGYTATGVDYAEFFYTTDMSLGDNDVVCRDPSTAQGVKKCEVGNHDVVGVTSTSAAFIASPLPAAGIDLATNPNYALVGMVGQVDTKVTAAEGAIAIGDPITASSTIAGYGAKAHGPVQVVGFALEAVPAGMDTIKVLVQPQWYGGDVLTSDGTAMVSSDELVMAPLATANATTSYDSEDITLRGSGWDGSAVTAKEMSLRTNMVDGDDAYRLSVVNDDGLEVAYVGESGDLAIAGKLYPSDRGTLQTSRYIYYDGSSGGGGDMMRTNAAGWGSGSYDFAEMFPSRDALAAGEVVVFADGDEEVRRSTGQTYDDRIAGIISTQPGFLAGENIPGHVPVALTGRVPTYVSGENGAIAIGDPLTTSSKPGYAMKATEPGPIVGYAMEAFNGSTGAIIAVVRPSYYDGAPVEEAPAAENLASQLASISQLNLSGSVNLNGGSILSIASLSGIGGNWSLSDTGDFTTRGRVTSLVRGYDGQDVPTIAALGRETTIQISGTTTLENGMAYVTFEQVDSEFTNIISTTAPYRVIVTPSAPTGQLYVTQRSQEGFMIRDAGMTDGVLVDWLVIAYHKDFAPEPTVVEDVIVEPEVVEDVIPELDAVEPVTGESISDEVVVPAEEAVPTEDLVSADEPQEPVTETPSEALSETEEAVSQAPQTESTAAVVVEEAADAVTETESDTLPTADAPTEEASIPPATDGEPAV